VTVFDDFLAASVPTGAVGLMWLGRATVALRVEGAVVLVDPFLSAHPERLVPPPCSGADARGVDVVLVTHDHLDHLDHLDDATLAAVAAASPYAAIVTPPEVVERVVGLGIDKRRVHGLPAWETTSVAGVVVRAVPA
jgi:L-ascorbate 6-phosphate lactonase